MRHIFSANEDVQYKQGTSSVQMRVCNMSETYYQVLVHGGTTQRYFSLSESLLPLIYQVKTVNQLKCRKKLVFNSCHIEIMIYWVTLKTLQFDQA